MLWKRRPTKTAEKGKQLYFQSQNAVKDKPDNKFFEIFTILNWKESGWNSNLVAEQCQEFKQFFTSVEEKLKKKRNNSWNSDKIYLGAVQSILSSQSKKSLKIYFFLDVKFYNCLFWMLLLNLGSYFSKSKHESENIHWPLEEGRCSRNF